MSALSSHTKNFYSTGPETLIPGEWRMGMLYRTNRITLRKITVMLRVWARRAIRTVRNNRSLGSRSGIRRRPPKRRRLEPWLEALFEAHFNPAP